MNRCVRTRSALVALAIAALLFSAAPAAAGSPAGEFGKGCLTVLSNIVYMPVKTIYAAGGGLVAGIAWVFSGGDSDVSRPIVDASLRGDYVVTKSHLERKDRLEFVGRSPAQRQAEQRAAWESAGANEGY